MIISFGWTSNAFLAGRKKVTRRDWSREYAARFREGTVHLGYNRSPRVGGRKAGDIVITKSSYPERTCDIPDEDFELEGLAYMEEKGMLIKGRTPREFFDNWRSSRDVLFVVRFDLVFKCDRCGTLTRGILFGPENDKRLCPLCWVDWNYYGGCECEGGKAWRDHYATFCATERAGVKVLALP